jgi:hypothetical protein
MHETLERAQIYCRLHKQLRLTTRNVGIPQYIGIVEPIAIAEEIAPLAVVPAPSRSRLVLGGCRNAGPIEVDEEMSFETVKPVAPLPFAANRYAMLQDRERATSEIGRPLRDHPALYRCVKSGRSSAGAAAQQAGSRKERKMQTRFEQIVHWLPALTPGERRELKELLS